MKTLLTTLFAWTCVLAACASTPCWAETITWKPKVSGDWFEAANWTGGRAPMAGDDVVIAGRDAQVRLSKSTPELRSLTVSQTLIVSGWETTLKAANVLVEHGGRITLDQPFKDKAAAGRIFLECTGALRIQEGGAISADGKGYAGGVGHQKDKDPTSAGFGPGAGGFPAVWGASAGGSHGGRGGTLWAKAAYGNDKEPTEPGSGGGGGNGVGGGPGGGAIRIIAKQVVVNGNISANGGDGITISYGGGGSGGSIFITCDTLGGRGAISANGGGGSLYAGGGGGGRIAVEYKLKEQKNLDDASRVEFSAVGGANGLGGMWGTQHADHFGEVGSAYFTDSAAPGRLLPQTGHVVGTEAPAKGLKHLTISYWMPWAVNTPIGTVKKELNKKHPRPRAAAVYNIQYVGPKLEMMSVQSVEVRDDVSSEVQRRFSTDNGKTWSKFEPMPSSDVRYDGHEASEGSGAMEYDPTAGVLVQTWLRQFKVGNRYHNASYYAYSRDLGKTWTPLKQLRYEDGDNFDPKNPLKPGYLNKNQGYTGNNILVHSNGTLITGVASANAPGDPDNDSRSWRLGSLCFIGKWNPDKKDYDWTPGKRVEITMRQSVRGLLEPEVAELKGGRVLIVWRGANAPGPEGGNVRAEVPGHRWFSVSDDGGKTLSEVKEWKYDDGTPFYSPSSIHRMIRHSKTGKLYWFGNICPIPPEGNLPRFPLVMAEVDEKLAALKRSTVTLIDDRDEKKHGFNVQFSNFSLIENRETHALELYLPTYNQERDDADWATADNYKYTVTLR